MDSFSFTCIAFLRELSESTVGGWYSRQELRVVDEKRAMPGGSTMRVCISITLNPESTER